MVMNEMDYKMEEYKELCSFIRTFFTLRIAVVSICISIFGAIFIFSTVPSVSFGKEYASIVLFLTILASAKLTSAISRAIYRMEMHISNELESKLNLSFFSNWIKYLKNEKWDNVTRAIIPIYMTLNILGAIYYIVIIWADVEKQIQSVNKELLIICTVTLINTVIFIWNILILTKDIDPSKVINQFERKSEES